MKGGLRPVSYDPELPGRNVKKTGKSKRGNGDLAEMPTMTLRGLTHPREANFLEAAFPYYYNLHYCI